MSEQRGQVLLRLADLTAVPFKGVGVQVANICSHMPAAVTVAVTACTTQLLVIPALQLHHYLKLNIAHRSGVQRSLTVLPILTPPPCLILASATVPCLASVPWPRHVAVVSSAGTELRACIMQETRSKSVQCAATTAYAATNSTASFWPQHKCAGSTLANTTAGEQQQ